MLDVEERDRYDRVLAYVYRADDGLFVNLAMATDGYAGVRIAAALASVAALAMAPAALAQDFPSKPVRWIVPSAPGDGGDQNAPALRADIDAKLEALAKQMPR